MKLKVFTADASSSEERDFAGLPSFEGDSGLLALKQYIIAYQANQRQGNAHTKTRAEVRGTSKKPFRQKGTGRGRQGSFQSPLQKGGGVVFGPRKRDYSQKVNKKVKAVAFKRALFDRAVAGEVSIIERFSAPEKPKTTEFSGIVSKVSPQGTVLIVDDSWSDTTILSARNIARLDMTDAEKLNPYDLCRYDHIIVSEKGFEKIISRVSGE